MSSKMHRWQESGHDQVCMYCGLMKMVVKDNNFVRTQYWDAKTGEMWLRAPVCDRKLVNIETKLDNQLKLDL